jgi:hypothetical protein
MQDMYVASSKAFSMEFIVPSHLKHRTRQLQKRLGAQAASRKDYGAVLTSTQHLVKNKPSSTVRGSGTIVRLERTANNASASRPVFDTVKYLPSFVLLLAEIHYEHHCTLQVIELVDIFQESTPFQIPLIVHQTCDDKHAGANLRVSSAQFRATSSRNS